MTEDIKVNNLDFSAAELFSKGKGNTYSDFTVLNTIYADITDKEESISLEAELGKGVTIKTPIIASPMDTVANAGSCIAVALEGGIGCIHYNHKKPDNTPDLDAQEKEVSDVKRSRNGFIENPVTVSPEDTIADAIQKGIDLGVAGSVIDTFPVTEDGNSDGKLVGLLRKEDYSRTQKTGLKVRERMLPFAKLIKAEWPMTLEQANDMLWDRHIPSLCIIDTQGSLKYLVTRTDVDKNEQYPLATTDENGRLRVLFAVGTRVFDPDGKQGVDYERLERCFGAGADGVVIDTSQGFTKFEMDTADYIRTTYPDKLLIGGNISTADAAVRLARWGLDAYRCGQGSGSICTTAGAIGIARSGAKAVYACASSLALNDKKMVTIADGGLKEVGDIFKAMSIGAHCVMLGYLLAGSEEGPGELTFDEQGRPVKIYRGMGSAEANVGGIRGYSRLPQGESRKVLYRGSLHRWIPLIRDGLLSAFHAVNCGSVPELHGKLYSGELRFEERSVGALAEAGIHSVL